MLGVHGVCALESSSISQCDGEVAAMLNLGKINSTLK